MKKVGLWIDHHQALITVIDAGKESQQVIESDLERHPGPPGGRRTGLAYGPQAKNLDSQREAKQKHHLASFYKDVIKAIGKPDQLLVMGPAEAKREFAQMVEKSSELRGVKIRVEAADRMTEAQVATKVRSAEF
jgi:hypothetical protein